MQKQVFEENMSNLTSASGEASVSTGNKIEASQVQPVKRKRNQPGNPDPDAEVIAMSPKSLMATNRFVCDICSKGFQRDQNLQLHRRGHNLPWKLKQRTTKEVKKKVYVCPEPSCVHHDPSRALGDLTGIKKHFSRKHGEKKWKCDKCSKKYAVQSDWKAHSKTCGTREYRCECGTLFSRRDSFITHRAFCDALAEESSRAITGGGESSSLSHMNLNLQQVVPQQLSNNTFNPPWLGTSLGENVNVIPHYQTALSPHMSATALLQKAAKMGATVSSKTSACRSSSSSAASPMRVVVPHQQTHVSADFGGSGSNNHDNTTTTTTTAGHFGLNLSIRDGFILGNTNMVHQNAMNPCDDHHHASSSGSPHPSLLLQGMLNSLSSADHTTTGFESTSFDDIAFRGILNANNKNGTAKNGGAGTGGDQGLTRDFLGIKAFSHGDLVNMADVSNYMNNTSHDQQQQHSQSQKPWQD